MKVTCIQDYKYNETICYRKDSVYEVNTKSKQVYTINAPGKPIKYFKIQSEDKNVCYRFPLSVFKVYFVANCGKNTENKSNIDSTANKIIDKPIDKIIPVRRKRNQTEFNVKDTFLELTSFTYPHGHEHKLKNMLPSDIGMDKHGNYFYNIGNSRTIFACHLDTVSKEHRPVKHIIEGDIIRTDGTSTLGADDKAGVTVLLYLINKRIPGTYYFFIGEEVGCIGSKAASREDNFTDYDRIISFDRKNTCSIITFQAGSRCCSEDFATTLCTEYNNLEFGLELKPDDGGVYTDSAEFTDIIPECTNISVGYYSEHTHAERQDINYLERLCEASAKIKWESLPVTRNPKVKEPKKYITHHNTEYARGRAQHWNHGHNNVHNHHNVSKRDRNNFKNYDFNDYDSVFYNDLDEALIDSTYDNRRNKKNKKSKKHRNNDIRIINNREIEYSGSKDIYLAYREYLSEKHYIADLFTSGSLPIFSSEEYSILEETLVESYCL